MLFLKLKRLSKVTSKEVIVNREFKQVHAMGLKLSEKQWPLNYVFKDK